VDERQVGEILLWHTGRWQTPNRARTLASLIRIYENNQVIVDGRALALRRCCAAARLLGGRAPSRDRGVHGRARRDRVDLLAVNVVDTYERDPTPSRMGTAT
jgi:hypothetical protein